MKQTGTIYKTRLLLSKIACLLHISLESVALATFSMQVKTERVKEGSTEITSLITESQVS